MPSAICNTCGSLVHYHHGHLKKHQCQCGSKGLDAVKGSLKDGPLTWEYTDRHGTVRKTEFVFHGAHKPLNIQP